MIRLFRIIVGIDESGAYNWGSLLKKVGQAEQICIREAKG